MLKVCAKTMCNELKIQNFNLKHDSVDDFYKSQWQNSDRSVIYLVYRWLWVLCCAAVFISCLICQFYAGKFFIFLTNWGIMLCLLTQTLAAVLVTRWHYRPTPNMLEMYFQLRVYWLLYVNTLPLAFVITIIYWSFLHGKADKPVDYPVLNIIMHCLNSVFMLLDLLIVALPLRLLHIIYAFLLPVVFCIFSLIYHVCGGTDEYGRPYIYPILDWNRPQHIWMTLLGVFVLYAICYVALFWIYRLRCIIHRLYLSSQHVDDLL